MVSVQSESQQSFQANTKISLQILRNIDFTACRELSVSKVMVLHGL